MALKIFLTTVGLTLLFIVLHCPGVTLGGTRGDSLWGRIEDPNTGSPIGNAGVSVRRATSNNPSLNIAQYFTPNISLPTSGEVVCQVMTDVNGEWICKVGDNLQINNEDPGFNSNDEVLIEVTDASGNQFFPFRVKLTASHVMYDSTNSIYVIQYPISLAQKNSDVYTNPYLKAVLTWKDHPYAFGSLDLLVTSYYNLQDASPIVYTPTNRRPYDASFTTAGLAVGDGYVVYSGMSNLNPSDSLSTIITVDGYSTNATGSETITISQMDEGLHKIYVGNPYPGYAFSDFSSVRLDIYHETNGYVRSFLMSHFGAVSSAQDMWFPTYVESYSNGTWFLRPVGPETSENDRHGVFSTSSSYPTNN